MNNIIISVFILLGHTVAFSQNEKQIDSLLVVLNDSENYKSQINTLHSICLEYATNSKANLKKYNQKILILSRKHKYDIGYGLYYLNCSRVHSLNNKYNDALQFSKKAASILIKNNAIGHYLNNVIEMAKIYIGLSDNQKSKLVLNQNLKLALNHKNKDILLNFYRLLGDNNCFKHSIAKSLFYYKKGIPLLSKEKSISKSYFFQRISDQYISLNQNEKALVYINFSIENSEEKAQFLVEAKKALLLNELGRHKEALDLSLKNYQTIYKYKRTSEWQYNLILYNIANAYYKLKKYNAAVPYINKVIDSKNTIQEYKIECYVILSNIYFDLNKKKEARFYSNKGLVFHDSLYKQFENFELNANVSKIEEDLGNYKKALYFYRKQINFTQKRNNKINNENHLLLQIDFDITLKDYNIKTLQEQKTIKTVENKNQKDLLTFICVLLSIALAFIFFYIKTNKTIKNKNKVIETEKIRTQKSLVEKEILLKEIHHRVKNNMQMVISLLKIQALDAQKLTVEDFISVSEARINSMVLVHENLYQSQNLSKVDFKEYMNNLISSIISSYQGFKKIELQLDVHDIYFDIQTAIPIGLIVSELINNAYKHAFVNRSSGTIKISLKENKKKFTLTISDNGIGFENKQEQQNGLGLELVRLLVSQIKGTLQIENSLGTIFTIQFKTIKL
ncbi:histidine kinase dimerization/phosphoacceptor domain -containing protein [Flavobacterium sp. XS1P32]|uniref:tetratricopeptide repeat-containing sensor histidine kinase n=1 Tax=Flavobacterium sp. XS1P32 TaxID=3401726 RepID=UPI003AB04A36